MCYAQGLSQLKITSEEKNMILIMRRYVRYGEEVVLLERGYLKNLCMHLTKILIW